MDSETQELPPNKWPWATTAFLENAQMLVNPTENTYSEAQALQPHK